MQLQPITHHGQGFLITTLQTAEIKKEGIECYMDRDSSSIPYSDQAKFPLHLYTSASGYSFNFFDQTHQPKLSFYYSEPYLLKFRNAFPDLINFHKQIVHNTYVCDPEMTAVIIKVINCSLPKETAMIWLEAKALELLTLALERVSAPEDTSMRLSKNDLEMLHTARELVIADFENIPTIKQLARKVGTNDNKLKRGFKQLFGLIKLCS